MPVIYNKKDFIQKILFPKADENGIDPAFLAAILNVECNWPRRTGFDRSGRVVILYEAHIAYRVLKRIGKPHLIKRMSETKVAGCPLVRKRWKRCYPRLNGKRWEMLTKAVAIAGSEMYRAASYGLPQILGENYKACGFKSVVEMVEEFQKGQEQQVDALIKFVFSYDKIAKAIREKDFQTFARYYNGPGYKKNKYDVRLKKAYDKYKKQLSKYDRLPQETDAERRPEQPVSNIRKDVKIPKKDAKTLIAALIVAVGSAYALFREFFESVAHWFMGLFQ